MQLEKVRAYPIPGYPTDIEFHEYEQLTRYMPRHWRGNRLVGQVLLFTTVTGLCAAECLAAKLSLSERSIRASLPKACATTLNAPRCSLGDENVLLPICLTEEDATRMLSEGSQESTLRPSHIDYDAMPQWHSAEDWDRDVAEYRSAWESSHEATNMDDRRQHIADLTCWLYSVLQEKKRN